MKTMRHKKASTVANLAPGLTSGNAQNRLLRRSTTRVKRAPRLTHSHIRKHKKATYPFTIFQDHLPTNHPDMSLLQISQRFEVLKDRRIGGYTIKASMSVSHRSRRF